MSSTVCARSAQSSAKRKSLISTFEVLVFDLSRRRLNTFPSVRDRMSAPKSLSWNASWNMAENTNLNNSGAITHPCLVRFVTENGSDFVLDLADHNVPTEYNERNRQVSLTI